MIAQTSSAPASDHGANAEGDSGLLLSLRGVSKSFSGVAVLREITMAVRRGEVVALLGENGAGKSTLKNILSGLLSPDSGEITLSGETLAALDTGAVDRHGIGTIHQELSLFDNLSVAENIHMPHLLQRRGLVNWSQLEIESRRLLRDELHTSINPRSLVENLSLGERQMVEIAKAMRRATSMLILDEPTTCLSLPEREQLFGVVHRLRQRGYAIIYITHFLEEVYELADQVVVMRDGVISDRGVPNDMPRDRITRAMVGRELAEMHVEPQPVAAGAATVLEVRNVSDEGLVREVSFSLQAGEILGIGGLMGAGRSELAEVLVGLRPGRGEVVLNGTPFETRSPRASMERGLVLVSEDRRRDQAFLNRSLRENITAPILRELAPGLAGWLHPRREAALAEEIALRFGVQPPRIETAMINFSGGNQQKAIIGRWLSRAPKVAILRRTDQGSRYRRPSRRAQAHRRASRRWGGVPADQLRYPRTPGPVASGSGVAQGPACRQSRAP